MTAAIVALDIADAIAEPVAACDDGSGALATTLAQKIEQGAMVVILLVGLVSPVFGAILAAFHH